MSSPRNCSRCASVIADDSVSELCPICRSSTDDERNRLFTPLGNAFFSSSNPPASSSPANSNTATQSPPAARSDSTITGPGRDVQAATNDWTPADGRPADGEKNVAALPAIRLPASPPGYEVVRRLGRGGMGDVFLAHDSATERTVAMKFLRAAHHPTAVERFLAEVRALGRIDHPYIVKVLATDFFAAVPYFTMEYVSGGTLSERVNEGGPMPVREAAKVMAAVARAVHAAHQANVLHRDLKPSNILLGVDGNPRVADFGLAKRTDREDDLTQLSGPLGTPSFMPPEQVSKAHGELGPASDVYGLGATLYYLLAGRPPFQGDSSAEIATKVVGELPSRLRTLRPEVPGGLEGIVAKCLEKPPAARYPTALALSEDLERFLVGERQQAPELTRWRRARRWAGRYWLQLASAAAIVALLWAAWYTKPVATTATQAAAETPPEPSDPAEAIRKELAEGKAVRLLKPDGNPRSQGWPLGPVELRANGEEGGTASIISVTDTRLLLLLDDPGLERYRVSLELWEVKKGGLVRERSNSKLDATGLVFGFAFQPAAGNRTLFSGEIIGFSDFDLDGKAPNSRELQLREWAVSVSHPLEATGVYTLKGPYVPLKPLLISPRWRKVSMEITPNGIRVTEPPGFQEYTAGEVQAKRMRLSEDMAGISTIFKNLPAAQLAEKRANMLRLPAWGPRMPLGIWCRDAEVAFRNVVIEALK